MFSPSALVSPSALPFIGWPLVAAPTMASADSSAHRRRIYAEASPGKNIFLRFTPAASTSVNRIVAFGLLCNLNHLPMPHMLSCSSVQTFAVLLTSLRASQPTSLQLAKCMPLGIAAQQPIPHCSDSHAAGNHQNTPSKLSYNR
mgnify:CR=1 FL=1